MMTLVLKKMLAWTICNILFLIFLTPRMSLQPMKKSKQGKLKAYPTTMLVLTKRLKMKTGRMTLVLKKILAQRMAREMQPKRKEIMMRRRPIWRTQRMTTLYLALMSHPQMTKKLGTHVCMPTQLMLIRAAYLEGIQLGVFTFSLLQDFARAH